MRWSFFYSKIKKIMTGQHIMPTKILNDFREKMSLVERMSTDVIQEIFQTINPKKSLWEIHKMTERFCLTRSIITWTYNLKLADKCTQQPQIGDLDSQSVG
jgi:hypothetical protein